MAILEIAIPGVMGNWKGLFTMAAIDMVKWF